jgi:hypothetical protein
MIAYSTIEAQPVFYSGITLCELLYRTDELPRFEPKKNARFVGLGWRNSSEDEYHEYPKERKAKTNDPRVKKRVDRYKEVMLDKSPMTAFQLAALMPSTDRAETITADNVWSAMRKLMKSGHVLRIKKGNIVRFEWIGG